MIVERLPIEKEWKFQEEDDVVITFSMKASGVLISLVSGVAFAQIRTGITADSALVSEGTVSITSDVITVVFAKEDLLAYVDTIVYGNIRLKDSTDKYLTLLKFSAEIEPTNTREVLT